MSERNGSHTVVLIDEYDKPILDNIDNPELAVAIREELKNYYSGIKDSDPYLQFVFITGVSKFSKDQRNITRFEWERFAGRA